MIHSESLHVKQYLDVRIQKKRDNKQNFNSEKIFPQRVFAQRVCRLYCQQALFYHRSGRPLSQWDLALALSLQRAAALAGFRLNDCNGHVMACYFTFNKYTNTITEHGSSQSRVYKTSSATFIGTVTHIQRARPSSAPSFTYNDQIISR